jgi:hypothetical protein
MNGSGIVDSQSKEPRPAPPSDFVCAEERLRSVSATEMTPYSNSAALWADVAHLAFCFRHLPIWASFRKKIIEDAMTRNILQEENCKLSNKLSHHPNDGVTTY